MPAFTFHHIHLRSRNPMATAQYYRQMFDAKIIEYGPNGRPTQN